MSRKPYIRKVPKTSWYLRQGRYIRYMGREVTCIFIGIYTFVLIFGIKALSQGPDAYQAFLDGLQSPVSVVFHLLALAFAVYHATSWFNVTDQAMPVLMGDEFLPGGIIVGAHYAGWAIVSLVVLFLAGVF